MTVLDSASSKLRTVTIFGHFKDCHNFCDHPLPLSPTKFLFISLKFYEVDYNVLVDVWDNVSKIFKKFQIFLKKWEKM